MKRRAKKRRRAGALTPVARGTLDISGVPLGGTTHPPGSGRGGGGRLGRAFKAAANKPPAPVGKQQAAGKALARWEDEGGRAAPRATSDHAKKTHDIRAPEKSVAKRSSEKVRAKPGASAAKDRR